MTTKYSLLSAAAAVCLCAPPAIAALAPAGAAAAVTDKRAIMLGFAAALTMSLCVFAASYAVARIGTAVMGAAAEKPELLVRSLLFVALAEGLAVLGFVIAMMLLQKI